MSWCLYSCFNFSESRVYQATLLWSVKRTIPWRISRSLYWETNHSSWKGLFLRWKRIKSNKSWLYDPMIFPALFPSCHWNKVHAPGKRAQTARPDRFTLRILQFRSSTARLARGVIFLSSAGACLFAGYFDWGSIHCVIRNHVCVLFHIHFSEIRSTPVLHRNLLTVARAKRVSQPRLEV